VAYLHHNNIIHGNLSSFQIYCLYEFAKIKHNFSSLVTRTTYKYSFIDDIQAIAIIAYEMTYGIVPFVGAKETIYEK
jgi:hypothetical protein